LFVFCVALAAANVLGLIKGALRAAHGAEKAEEVSGYYLGDEIAGTQRGMMIAIPAAQWLVFAGLTPEQLAGLLRELAGKVRLAAFRRHRRGPKKPPVKRRHRKKQPHGSTAPLLDQRRPRKTQPESHPFGALDLETRKERASLKGHSGQVPGLAVSADSRTLASAAHDGDVMFWDIPRGEKLGTISAHNGYAMAVAFSPDGKTIASGGSDKKI